MSIVFNFSNCKVSVKYLKKVNNSKNWYYVRRIPKDLLEHEHYASKNDKRIVRSTKTSNKLNASKKASQINRLVEAEWDELRNGSINLSAYKEALKLLSSFGLNEKSFRSQAPHLFDDFQDYIESKISDISLKEAFDEESLGYTDLAESTFKNALGEVDRLAFDVARGKVEWKASFILKEHLDRKGWANNRKQRNDYFPAFNSLISLHGDRRPRDYSFSDVDDLIKSMLSEGLKTSTVKKRMGCIRAAFNNVTKIHSLNEDRHHPFTGYTIPNLKEDASDRRDFTVRELQTLRQNLRNKKDSISGLIAIMMETGLRVKEVCGLMKSDVTVANKIMYVQIHKNPMRRLKTKSSKRIVPLVGLAKKFVTHVDKEWLIEDYVDTQNQFVKNDSASAAVNKRLKAILGDDAPTAHSFRHTINTRLRDIGCPKDIRDELGGWAKSISDNYGSPTDISKKNEYLLASLEWKGQTK